MSPLARPLLALAAAALLAAAAGARGPAPRPAPRSNQRLNMPSPCDSIVIGEDPLSPLGSSIKIKFTFTAKPPSTPFHWGTEINITDYCSLMHTKDNQYNLHPEYYIAREEVGACGSFKNPPTLVATDSVFSPVLAYCDDYDPFLSGCGPLQMTVVQYCRPLYYQQ